MPLRESIVDHCTVGDAGSALRQKLEFPEPYDLAVGVFVVRCPREHTWFELNRFLRGQRLERFCPAPLRIPALGGGLGDENRPMQSDRENTDERGLADGPHEILLFF